MNKIRMKESEEYIWYSEDMAQPTKIKQYE
jgi:hypothetical protein